jgi:mRNA interferase RelE/StbE
VIVHFDKSFAKSLDRVNDQRVLSKVEWIITQFEKADSIKDISNVKKIQGFISYYRIRIGDYRLGIEMRSDAEVHFILISHRKDIYNKFP